MTLDSELINSFHEHAEELERCWCLPWYRDRQPAAVWAHPVVGALRDAGPAVQESVLQRLLNEQRFPLRGVALFVVAERGWSQFSTEVRDSLDHPSIHVRALAAHTIGVLGDLDGLEDLLETRDNEHPEVKKSIVRALHEIKDSRSIPLLARWVGRVGEDDELRRRACEALGNIGDDAAMPVLSRVIEDGNVTDGVRTAAARAVRMIGGEEAEGLIRNALGSPSPRVRQAGLGALCAPLIPSERAALLERARTEPDANLREVILQIAAATLSAGELLPLATECLQDAAPTVRIASLSVLARLEGREVGPTILRGLDDPKEGVRQFALKAYCDATGHPCNLGDDALPAEWKRAMEDARRHQREMDAGSAPSARTDGDSAAAADDGGSDQSRTTTIRFRIR